jgi:hypothetical protein
MEYQHRILLYKIYKARKAKGLIPQDFDTEMGKEIVMEDLKALILKELSYT